MTKITLKLITFALLICPLASHGDKVSIHLKDNLIAHAAFQAGEADKPILLFIHGFLQTNQFSTVRRLYEAFAENGYPVLAPTFSLGISNRSKSLPCESIHLHSLQSDTEEISHWVNWASAKGYENIVLVGHSAGSVNITAWLAGNHHPRVRKTIMISLTHYGPDRPAAYETREHEARAIKMQKQGDEGLDTFALNFCREYVTTATHFLSYYQWSDQKVLQALQSNGSENFVIIGSADDRIDSKWLQAMQSHSANIRVVKGASHFFDQTHEFDLLDLVETIIDE